MKSLVCRTLNLNLSSSPLCAIHMKVTRSYLLLHSASGEDTYRRRSEGNPSSSSSPPFQFFNSLSSPRRNYDEENRIVKITVWWDFENCSIPVGVNVHRVANRITWSLRSCGIKGPVTITAFGDVAQLSRGTQEALTSTGICLTHVPHSGKNSSDRSLMADIVYWVSQNPPPAHFFLISGDKDFANILHRLRMSNYNILLASTGTASGVLCSAATLMWPWNGLVKGENTNVRHFNYPPDGLYGSWYGHHKGVLDDPFSDSDLPTTSQPEESMESISECKPRPVPRVVVNGVRLVLHSYPEGISPSELRLELRRNNISIDKDFFGHKKFSNFLASLNILKFVPSPTGDRQPLVVGTHKKAAEQPEISTRSAKEIDNNGLFMDNYSKQHGNATVGLTTISNEHSSNDIEANGTTSSLFKEDHTVVNLEANKGASALENTALDHSVVSQKSDSMVVEDWFIKKLWKVLSGIRIGFSLNKVGNSLETESFKHEDNSKNVTTMHVKHDAAANRKVSFPMDQKAYTSVLHSDKSITKDNATVSFKGNNFVLEQNVGLIRRVVKWCRLMMYGIKDQDDCPVYTDKVVRESETASEADIALPFSNIHQSAHELFSKPHFWNALESFLLTSNGCDLILKSRTRVQLVQRLQNEGPKFLKELNRNQLFCLVDILVLEKKWLEECVSQIFPFRLIIPAKKISSPSQPSHCNGLSSLFSDKVPLSNLQKMSEQEMAKQNPVAVGISETEIIPPHNIGELRLWFQKKFGGRADVEPDELQKLFEDKFSRKLCASSYGHHSILSLVAACSTDFTNAGGKWNGPSSRENILMDCRKLVKELIEKNSTGFNISIFRDEFIKKYGYVLDYQTLGYPKLVCLLQIMPGVRVDSSYIRPSNSHLGLQGANVAAACPAQVEDSKGKDILLENGQIEDSVWEELGPLSSPIIKASKNYQLNREVAFSPVSLSDDEYTDSDEDAPRVCDRLGYSKEDVEDSSLLLRILDSWDAGKGLNGVEGKEKRNLVDDQKEQRKAVDGLIDCSKDAPLNHSTISFGGLQKVKLRAGSKRFSFVSQNTDEKDCLRKAC